MDTNVDAEFSEFVVRHSPALFRVAYALTGDADTAESLVERAVAKAFVRWRRIHETQSRTSKGPCTATAHPDGGAGANDSRARRFAPPCSVCRLDSGRSSCCATWKTSPSSRPPKFLGWRPGRAASQAARALAKLRDLTHDRPVDDGGTRDVMKNLAAEGDLVRPEERDRRRFALDATDRGYQYRNRLRGGLVGAVVLVVATRWRPVRSHTSSEPAARGESIRRPTRPATDTVIGPDGVPTHVITDKTRPIELVAVWDVSSEQVRARLARQDVPADERGNLFELSPNGEWVVTKDRPLDFTSVTYRVTNLRTGEYRQLRSSTCDRRTAMGRPMPTRLLLSKTPEGEPPTRTLVAVMLDVTTGTTTASTLDVTGLSCAEVGGCRLTWLPSGTEIAITGSRRAGREPSLRAVRCPERSPSTACGLDLLPIAGIPSGPHSWSPDNRVLVRGTPFCGTASTREDPSLIEVATGTVVRRMAGLVMQATWVDNDRILIWKSMSRSPTSPLSSSRSRPRRVKSCNDGSRRPRSSSRSASPQLGRWRYISAPDGPSSHGLRGWRAGATLGVRSVLASRSCGVGAARPTQRRAE